MDTTSQRALELEKMSLRKIVKEVIPSSLDWKETVERARESFKYKLHYDLLRLIGDLYKAKEAKRIDNLDLAKYSGCTFKEIEKLFDGDCNTPIWVIYAVAKSLGFDVELRLKKR